MNKELEIAKIKINERMNERMKVIVKIIFYNLITY